ncbi:MAG: hypothetical protein IJ767_01060 [Bacteroidaceae bacterium]|nr:hypothetical protein [Bacteroidaceae bacterium]
MKKILAMVAVVMMTATPLVICGLVTACNGTSAGSSHVGGTLNGPLREDTVPTKVLEAMERAERFHQHELMSDAIANVAVFSIDEADTTSTEGFGIVVTKGAASTTFPNIRNVRQPRACYHSEKGNLWLTSSQMEGTGVAVERPYLIRFGDNDIAYIAATIDPYDMQQALCQRLHYAVEGRQVTLCDGDSIVATVTVHETNMGDLYEDAVWIGEQLTYEADSDGLTVCITPGLSFNTGRVLLYDDMPTLKARVTLDDDGTFTLGCIGTKDNVSQSKITAEMAFEGVCNYCHGTYDWSAAEENPDIMGLEMGEETESAYHVVFRSYTGALVNFYVDKADGTTRMVEYVPTLDRQEEAGTMNLFDYLK